MERYTGGVNARPPSDPGPSAASPAAPTVFREEQHFRQWWIWVLVVGPAALAWWPFIEQIISGRPVGHNPPPDWLVWLIWIFVGLGFPFLFGRMSLIVEVTETALHIRFRPFSGRTIAIADIRRVEVRTYNAVREYGGWGVKGWSKDKMAYSVSGHQGAELTLTDGRKVMLGSQRAEELAAAIEAQRRRARPRRRA